MVPDVKNKLSRYKTDEDYRNKILEKERQKYHTNKEYRERKMKWAIEYSKTYVHSKSQKFEKKKYLGTYYEQHREHAIVKSKFNRDNNRYEVLYWYSDGLMKCNVCGEDHREFLCIDHIDDTGAEHRKEMGFGGGRIYRYLLKNKFPEGYQVLCNNCNFLKEYSKVQNKLKSKTKYAIARRKQQKNTRLKILYWYSNGLMKCDCCGTDDIRVLTIDHINGGGKQHVIKDKIKNLHEYLYQYGYPEGYRILCWNCNKSHGQYGYCPHKR